MLTCLLLGGAVGIVLALTGAGGGILAVPLLVLGAGLGVAEAGPVSLLAIGMAAALGAAIGLKAGNTRYRAAAWMSLAGMLLAPAGVWLAHRLDRQALAILFAGVLLYVALQVYRQRGRRPPDDAEPLPCVRGAGTGRFIWTRSCAYALAACGALAGLLSGLLGVGGGFAIVPALRRFTDLDMRSATATSLGAIALVSAAGIAASAAAGVMRWDIAAPFVGGALIGMLGGRAFAGRLGERFLQTGFAAVSAIAAAGMILKSLD